MFKGYNVIEGANKLQKEKTVVPAEIFISTHSKVQQEFLRCKYQNIMFYGGRRAGKTMAVNSKIILLDQELPVGGDIMVACSTVEKARRLYWGLLHKTVMKMGIDWEFQSGKNTIITPNRQIFFHGLRDIPSATLPSGRPVAACIVEEAHTIRNDILEYYMKVSVRPAFQQFSESYKMIFVLNPPVGRLQYLHDVYESPVFKKIRIRSKDNPIYSDEKKYIAHLEQEAKLDKFKTLKEAMETPLFQRNVLGMWVYENNRLVIDVDKIETFENNPPGYKYKSDFITVIGVDFGGGKANHAVVVLQYSKYDKKVYAVEEWQRCSKDRTLEEVSTEIKKFYKKYTYSSITPTIVFDPGGHGDALMQEMRCRYGVPPMIKAKRTQKTDYLKLMQSEAHSKRLLFKKNESMLLREFPQIFFDKEFLEIDEDNSIHSDLIDACLYAYRVIRNYMPEVRQRRKSEGEIIKEERLKLANDKNLGSGFNNPLSRNFLMEQ